MRPADSELRLRLELESVAASVGLVRSLIGSIAATAGLERALVDDLRTAISEACNNVVLHAYEGEPGPLIFSLAVEHDAIEAVVRDHGCGIRAGSGRNRGLGMGIALIKALTARAEYETSAIGTEVRMRFARPARASATLSRFRLGVLALTDPQSSGALQVQSS